MQVMGLTSPFHSQRNSMNIQAVVPLQSQDGEPYALPCPTLLPCVLQTAPDWRRKHFLTLLYAITWMSYNLFNKHPTVKHLGGFQSFAFTNKVAKDYPYRG